MCFCSYTGLTENLLQKHQSDYEEVIEKLFSEVSGPEDLPKIPDPQVETCVGVVVLNLFSIITLCHLYMTISWKNV